MKVRGNIPPSTQSLFFKNRCYRYNVPSYRVEPTPQKPDERKNQSKLSKKERDTFIATYDAINTGDLGKLVSWHADMSHMMHSNMGPVGVQRFLPWHRAYLAELENHLQAINPDVTIPYWDWAVDQSIPAWISGFTPTVVGTNTPDIVFPIVVTRTPGLQVPNLPPQSDVDAVMAKTDYTDFTNSLEDGNFYDPALQTAMHDQVHVWVGGPMSSIPVAPADPLFWMHHANIDRLWSMWQKQNPNKNPILSGANANMDPMNVTEQQTR
ncbi:MAG TPA: tyrosinase family protein, partial [Nitrososphaeraceae archaeon]|nr:tyrosinase family protein [Nitrososphaeraceae archaeon]